jgi:hypothetical protein
MDGMDVKLMMINKKMAKIKKTNNIEIEIIKIIINMYKI